MLKHLRISASALVVGSMLCLTACGGPTFAMTPDSTVPFAKGQVAADVADDGNGTFTVSVEHLGDPAKLSPKATTYVVWVQQKKEDSPIQNMGALKVNEAYDGQHSFNATFKSFDLTITPEEDATVTKPTGRDILKTTVALDE